MAKEIQIEVVLKGAEAANSLKEIKTALKAVNDEILKSEEGSAEFDKLTASAGKLKDKVNDLNDTLKLQQGSGLERFTNSLKLAKEGVLNLDFGKIKTGIQGTTAAFGGLSKAIIATGIGLLVIGIIKLIQNFDEIKKAGGLVGKVFGAIGDAISFVTDGLTAISNAWGLTAIANDEATDSVIAYKKALTDLNFSLDEAVIQEQLLTGEITEGTAKRETAAVKRTQADLDALAAKNAAVKEAGKLNKKEAAEAIDAALEIFEKKTQLIELTYTNGLKEIEKGEKANAAATAKAAAAESKAVTDRSNAASKAASARIKAENDRVEKERAANLEKFLNDVASAEDKTLTEFQQIDKKSFDDRTKLQNSFALLTKAEQEANLNRLTQSLLEIDLRAIAESEALKAKLQDDLNKKKLDNLLKFSLLIRKVEIESQDKTAGELSKVEDERLSKRKELTDAFTELSNADKLLKQKEFQNALLEIDKNAEEARALIILNSEEKILETTEAARRKLIEKYANIAGNLISIFDDASSANLDRQVTNLEIEETNLRKQYDTRKAFIDANITDERQRTVAIGNLDSETFKAQLRLDKAKIELEKKGIRRERNISLASIALSTAVAIASATKATIKSDPVSFALSIAANLAAVFPVLAKARQAIQAANAAESALGAGGGPGIPDISAPTSSSTPAQVPSQFALFGTAGSSNNLGAPETAPIQAFVVESDITSTQRRLERFRLSSEL